MMRAGSWILPSPSRGRVFLTLLLLPLFFASCQKEPKEWVYGRSIDLEAGTLIGVEKGSEGVWVTDGGRKRLLHLDEQGELLSSEGPVQRPMHPAYHQGKLYAPEFLTDSIRIFQDEQGWMGSMDPEFRIDGPTGIAFKGKRVAIADFYNHRVHLRENGKWRTIGGEGN